jgi:uncharacterized protein YggL (DUF469 family)
MMKKRLRKKFRVGEFQEFGFAVELQMAGKGSEDGIPGLVDQFLGEVVEAGRLCASGCGHGAQWNFFLCSTARRGSVSEQQRQQVADWLAVAPGLASHEVGPLVDAWHGRS